MWFKTHKVWAACDASGRLREIDGKVRIKYRLDQPHEYRALRSNLRPLAVSPDKGARPSVRRTAGGRKAAATRPAASAQAAQECPAEAIRIYTDGASSGNPGPSGIGVVICHRDRRKEISRSIGIATNNIAELEAIHTALLALKLRHLPVCVYTDSSYALGVLSKGWKPKKNRRLIARIKALMAEFDAVCLIKVAGHAGDVYNERADALATAAAAT
jgi:ribonuclease HI